MRSKAWLATRVSLRLAQRSRRLCSTRAAALVLLAHAEATKITYFSMNPKFRYPHGTLTKRHRQHGICSPYDMEQASTRNELVQPHAWLAGVMSASPEQVDACELAVRRDMRAASRSFDKALRAYKHLG